MAMNSVNATMQDFPKKVEGMSIASMRIRSGALALARSASTSKRDPSTAFRAKKKARDSAPFLRQGKQDDNPGVEQRLPR
jgi:hypothetical protein